MINQLFVRMAGFFVCSGGTAACGEEDGCNTAMQKKKSHAGGEACGERAMAVIQPYKRRRAAPEARPVEKEQWL